MIHLIELRMASNQLAFQDYACGSFFGSLSPQIFQTDDEWGKIYLFLSIVLDLKSGQKVSTIAYHVENFINCLYIYTYRN